MIYDLDMNPLTTLTFAMESDQVLTAQIKVKCLSGYRLYCDTIAGMIVEGKHSLSGVWVNLESSETDLTAWAPGVETFDVRLTAGTETSSVTRRFKLRVTL